jgi:transglutaminase-like putative cysteine protease
MNTYTVAHRTTYRYQSDVAYSRLIAHLGPRPTMRQKTLAFEVSVTPEPAERFERCDFFGNITDWFTIDEPHEVLSVVAESRVAVDPTPAFEPDSSPSWESVRKTFEFPTGPETLEAVQYTFDTPLTGTNAEVVTYARKSFQRGRQLLACVQELNTRIHADFTYDKKATDTRTTAPRAFDWHAFVRWASPRAT